MSNQLAETKPKTSALGVMASRFNVEPAKLLSTLKNTVFKGASDDELLALVVVANEYSLNPLLKQIYAFPNKGGGIVPVVSIDGWLRVINSHEQMDGLDFEFEHDESGALIACTAIIHRKDRNRPIRVTEYLAECKRNTDPWKMEHRMLRHKALIQCARVAFGLSGIFDEDEAERIKAANAIEVTTKTKPVFNKALPDPIDQFKPDPEDDVPMDKVDVSAASAPADEPKFVADTPQKKLQLAVSDFGCPEHTFIKTYRSMNKKLVNGAETIAGLSNEAAIAALNEIDSLLAATEEGR